jgi:hypothetical protein
MAAGVSVRYRPNPAGLAQVPFMAGMRAHTGTVAGKYAAAVTAAWPRNTGAGARSVHAAETGSDRDGAYTQVATSSWRWHFVEFGTIWNPPYAPFRRAASSMGLRWGEVRR